MKKILIVILFCHLPLFGYTQNITIVTEDFPPYNYKENGVLKGVSTEVVLAVLKEINLTATIEIYPWARAYQLAQTKKNHLIYSIGKIPEREKMFHWVGSIAAYRTSLYKLKSRTDIKIESLNDAKQYSIGCSIADVITIYLQSKGFFLLEQVSGDTLNLHKLLRGRTDLIAYDEASFNFKIQQEGLDRSRYERVFRIKELSNELYLAFSKSSDIELVRSFRKGLQAIKDNGSYLKIQQKYFF